MGEIDKSSLSNEKCCSCKNSKVVVCNSGFKFLGCTHPPYKGKWVAEIKDCPKTQREDGEHNA